MHIIDKNIVDLGEVYNTRTVNRKYLIPWLSNKLGISDNYVIVNDNLYTRKLPELKHFDTIVLDLSPICRFSKIIVKWYRLLLKSIVVKK